MKAFFALGAALAVLSVAQPVLAQGKAELTAVKAIQIADARKANAALMRQYTWHSRIELIMNGAVKDTRIELVNYGPTGELQRTVLNDYSANLPIGFLMRAIAEHERKEVATYLKGLTAFLEQYTLPTAGKVLDFMTQAQVKGPDASGAVEMTGKSVVVEADTFSVWADARTRQTRKVHVASTFQGDAVNLTATFHTLPSRLTYVAYAELTVPTKQITLQVQNFDFMRSGSSAQAAVAAPKPALPPKSPAAVTPVPPAKAPASPNERLPLGTVVSALPTGCISTPVSGIEYYFCGGNFYRAVLQGNSLVYVTTQPK